MHPILQSESSECALASLAMVANAHGLQLDLFDLRRRFPVSLKGATLQQLISHAGALNFSSRPLRLEIDELAQLALPCILHWDLNHFVVLKKSGAAKSPCLTRRWANAACLWPRSPGISPAWRWS